MAFRPLHDRVLIRRVESEEKTRGGIIIRVPVDGIRVIGRNTQGVHVMHLDDGDVLVDVARVVKEDEGGAEEVVEDEAPVQADGQ